MKFGLVDPKERTYRIVDAADTSEALAMLGIPRDETDHGMVARDIGIIVYEFGLFVLPELQSYFAVGRRMYAGSAVLYGVGPAGETVDFRGVPSDVAIRWLRDRDTAEREIQANLVDRPRITVGGKTIWEWPNPNHPFMSKVRK